ncbi:MULTISPECIES: O-antigen ligase family protein [unclassified Bradyrhizobium]|uniref:O-antigen ligase family protein n=1 Tax=unclassified Bradyrhizobium TaxID=2631580 RepID=UPI002FF40344
MLLTAIWATLALVSVHGIDGGLQTAGIFVTETFGAFLFAKRYIRDIFAFHRMVKSFVLVVAFLFPFAVYENLTASPILVKLFGTVFSVFELYGPNEARFGLSRAQVTFEHPILFGIVCSSAFALSFYVLTAAKRQAGRLATGVVAITTFTSLSSGALLSLVVQGALIVWDKVTASVTHRWIVLAALAVVAFVAMSALSNRSAIEVLVTYLTFSADNSYMRIFIWNYGTQSVMKNPIFGIGLHDWERPTWMAGSIDNFWLVNAVRYGIPGFLFLFCSFTSVCFGLGRIRKLSFQASQCRKGLIITLFGFAIAGITVHFWNATYVLFIFLLGSGMWLFENENREGATDTQDVPSAVRPMF